MAARSPKSIVIQCPACGRETEQAIATLRTLTELTCPNCGAPIPLKHEELLRDLDEIDESWNDIYGGDDDREVP
jgi:hypothetical protein